MLNVPQIEALRKKNPHLYEALTSIAQASLGPNQGWSLDNQITDGVNYSRVSSGATTAGKIDPTKTGVLMKGSVPPTWSGAFAYVSATSTITWSWSALTIARADGTTTAVANGSLSVTGLTPGTTYYFYPYWDDSALALAWVGGLASSAGTPANAFTAKTNTAAQQQSLQGLIPLIAGCDDRGYDYFGRRRRLGRRQRKLFARWNDGAHARARHRGDRNLQTRRTSAQHGNGGWRRLDAPGEAGSAGCGHVHTPAFFE